METQVNPIPKGYHSITPYLIVSDAASALEFYKKSFNARELYRMDAPDGKITHCEFQIGDSKLMMADAFPQMGINGPEGSEGTAFSLLVYVEDVDHVFNEAVKAGAKVLRPLQNEFYGDRMGTIEDPFGHKWNLSQHIEDVSEVELKRRAEEMYSNKH